MAEWHEGLDPALVEHATAKGWIKEGVGAEDVAKEAVKAHYAIQKYVGVPAEQLVKLPKDASDPSYADAYKRVVEMGAPKDPKDYSFDGVKGIGEEDAAFVRGLAAELKLPVNAAASLAQKIVERAEGTASAQAEKNAMTLAAEQAILRSTWGANYDLNLFRVGRVAETLGWDKDTVDKLNNTVGGTKVLNGLLQLSGKMSEAAFLKGETGGGEGAMTREQATEKKAQLMAEAQGKVTEERFMAIWNELKQLDTIIVGAAQAR